ncbi:hypothetical protein H0H87_009379, partial [Tephrocybe sp. NHM501043]
MPLFSKPGFPKRFPKLFIHKDTDSTALHSIHAGISTVNMPVLALATGSSTIHDSSTSSSRDASMLYQTNQVVQYGLNVASPIVGAVPIAGGPLKGAIDALLVILKSVEKWGQNQEDRASLIQRLYRLDVTMASIPAATGPAQSQREELLRQKPKWARRAISRCIKQIDEHEQDFLVISSTRTQGQVEALAAVISHMGQLPSTIKHEVVFIMDATGREYEVLIDQCQSREQFMTVLGSHYYKNTEKDRVMRYYLDRGEYDLYVQGQTGPSEIIGWSGVEGGSRIVMSIRSE